MAQQQPYQAYQATQRGTLSPGQTISVNKFSVQVERYLTQGGFAHVYLVCTSTPVYNTTRHVLKRIAVPNEAMLSEVRKEVDIMRILKGHPNIVHLIDAAWHRMPNGVYEVFILMEFCPGGGIIDMMNRRLRERLTESEILQIFVDVCEGLAAMHNLRPPLLHRDLKVENILQSTATSFKLCDFGSATPVAQSPPASTAEIRALESDLNRHTTLQYRAPEMVDLFLRRPVDEKSDVWALGVLLYKLCYYTTPFEEHGPLAILNVQYRIPPYPVYSSQMNALIGSMLREHGAQRPSVFEILAHVHNIRGTKSRFTYTIPSPKPLSPRHNLQFSSPLTNPLENTVQYRSNAPNAGVQAREKVLEAIAPMRRGRPDEKDKEKKQKGRTPLDDSEVKAWNTAKDGTNNAVVRGHKSGFVSSRAEASKPGSPKLRAGGDVDDAWNLRGGNRTDKANEEKGGFGDNFSDKLSTSGASGSSPDKVPFAVRPESPRGTNVRQSAKSKDAFDGLGIPVLDKGPQPTLGEARKFRTGLAVVNGYNYPSGTSLSTSPQPPSLRPTPSPQPVQLPLSNPPSNPITPMLTRSTPRLDSTQQKLDGLPAETRFPPLEVLDSTFGGSSSSDPPGYSTNEPRLHVPSSETLSTSPSLPLRSSNLTEGLRPVGRASLSHDGVRSAQVTGIAMRGDASKRTRESTPSGLPSTMTDDDIKRSTITRPVLSRRHRSSLSIKPTSQPSIELLEPPTHSPTAGIATSSSPRKEPKDWLTGTDDEASTIVTATTSSSASHFDKPSKRDSRGKREPYYEKNSVPTKASRESATSPQHPMPHPRSPTKSVRTEIRVSRVQPSVSRETTPSVTTNRVNEDWGPHGVRSHQNELSSSDEHEGPEDASGYAPREASIDKEPKRKRKGRQSSVHDLVDLWGGGVGTSSGLEKELPSSQASVTPNATLDPKSPRRNAVMQPVPGLASMSTKQRSRSPQEISSYPAPNSPSHIRRTTGHRKQSSKTKHISPGAPPTPPHSARPQSMFIFPVSKSKSDGTPTDESISSPGLSPQSEQVPRRLRRTSISDIVQRYEAIGGKASPSVVVKPAALKGNVQTTPMVENEKFARTVISGSPRRTLEEPSNFEQRSSPRTSPVGRRGESNVMRTSRHSPSKSTSLSVDPSSLELSLPSREPEITSEDRASSPDKPYQGVGKLIDQWQRKTADADPSNGLRRGGPVSKRAGLVNNGRGQ